MGLDPAVWKAKKSVTPLMATSNVNVSPGLLVIADGGRLIIGVAKARKGDRAMLSTIAAQITILGRSTVCMRALFSGDTAIKKGAAKPPLIHARKRSYCAFDIQLQLQPAIVISVSGPHCAVCSVV
jgi:hypothetical protein